MFRQCRVGMILALPGAALVCLSCAFRSFPSPGSGCAGSARDGQDDARWRQAPRRAAAFHWLPDCHNEAYTSRRTFLQVEHHLHRFTSHWDTQCVFACIGFLFHISCPPQCCASNAPRAGFACVCWLSCPYCCLFSTSRICAHPTIPPQFPSMRRLRSVLETSRDATIVFDVELLKVKRAAGRRT